MNDEDEELSREDFVCELAALSARAGITTISAVVEAMGQFVLIDFNDTPHKTLKEAQDASVLKHLDPDQEVPHDEQIH